MQRSADSLPVTGIITRRQVFEDCNLIATYHSAGSRLEKHRHDSAFFVAVIEGAYYQTCRGHEALCDVRSVRYLAPDEVHSSTFKLGSLCLNLEIQPHHFCEIEPLLSKTNSGEIRDSTARNICQNLWNVFSTQDNLAEFAAHAAMLDLTGLLNCVRAGHAISPPGWLEKAREYLDAYCTSSLSLPQLSRAVNHHPTHVSREFHRWYGKSFVQFVRERRVLRAREMLLLSEQSIADISFACGFYDQSHFTNVFRQQFGYTPAQYRWAHVDGNTTS